MRLELAGKRVAITGASRGLGRATALACAREGADVVLFYREQRDAALEAVAEIEAESDRKAWAIALDITNETAIEAAIEEACSLLGGLDAWVNNAGEVFPGLLVTQEADRLRRAITVNLVGPMLCARAAIARMLRQRSGVVLFIGSVASARPARGQAAYAAAKGGIEALTRALAIEYARKGIRVLCLRPGPIDTDLLAATLALAEEEVIARVPQRRIATAAEIAEHAVFLLGDRAAYATGSVVTVDGGYVVA